MSPLTLPRFHPLLRFALVASALYLLWVFGYEHRIALDGRLDKALTENIAAAAAGILHLLGFDSAVSSTQLNTVLISQRPTVVVGTYCDGMVLYALFSGFVLAFPTASWHKLWFIPLGVALIYGINVLRIAALGLNNLYSHQTAEFNHHYTFTFVVYGFIGLLWVWWATRLAEPAATSSSPDAYA